MSRYSDLINSKILIEGTSTTFAEFLGIDEAKLKEEYAEQAPALGYIGARTAVAESIWQDAKRERELVYAEIENELRMEYRSAKEKITEARLKSEVLVEDDYIKATKVEIETMKDFKLLKSLTEAMKERGSMLISFGADLRAEYGVTDLQLKTLKARMQELRD